ncbi:MAG: ATP-binding cassette domain-containing protein [Oscillospiraceae bacterium]|nr:ATP-binding cassette domain-containing protein [Oscillospiraceae bacterium]
MTLQIKDLSKTYGKKKALERFSYTFDEGVYGILGPNGSGKSTLMNLITDNSKRETGQVLYNSRDILPLGEPYRATLGYMPQQQGLYEEFSGRKFLYYMANLKGLRRKEAKGRIEELLSIVGLTDDAHRKTGGYSGGMKQRLLLAQALLSDPKILILDEPTAGLDPKERIRIRSYIARIAKNKIVLLSTHIVQDIESIATQVILLKDGKLLVADSPSNLIASICGKAYERYCAAEEMTQLQERYQMGNVYLRQDGEVLRLVGDSKPEGFAPVTQPLGLEDVYLYYYPSLMV